MKNIQFDYDKPLGPKDEGLADVTLIGPSGTKNFTLVLVDSGADYVMLPRSAANSCGISLAGSDTTRKTVRGVGGSRSMYLRRCRIEIEGNTVHVDVLFDPKNGKPLLGRNGLRALGPAYGFDFYDWLWKV